MRGRQRHQLSRKEWHEVYCAAGNVMPWVDLAREGRLGRPGRPSRVTDGDGVELSR